MIVCKDVQSGTEERKECFYRTLRSVILFGGGAYPGDLFADRRGSILVAKEKHTFKQAAAVS